MAETGTKASPKKAATKPVAKSAAAAKPVKKAAAKPAVAVAKPAPAAKKPVAVKKPAAAKKPAVKAAKPAVLSDEQRYRMVAEAAYYRAEKNQFKSDPLRDWIDAENDISKLLSGGK